MREQKISWTAIIIIRP